MIVSSSARSMCSLISFSWFTFQILLSLTIKIPAQGNFIVHPCSVYPHQHNQKGAPKLMSIISLSSHISSKLLTFLLLYKAELFLWIPTRILPQDSTSYCSCYQLSPTFSASDTALKPCSCTGILQLKQNLTCRNIATKKNGWKKSKGSWCDSQFTFDFPGADCKRTCNVEGAEMVSYCKIIFTRIKWCLKM